MITFEYGGKFPDSNNLITKANFYNGLKGKLSKNTKQCFLINQENKRHKFPKTFVVKDKARVLKGKKLYMVQILMIILPAIWHYN